MIRINLLPREEKRGKPKASRRGVSGILLGFLAVFATIGVISILHFSQVSEIKKTNDEIRVTQREIDDIKEIEVQVNEYKKRNKEIERQIEIITNLEKRKYGPLYVMDSLSSSVPERLWIDGFKSKGNSVTLKGIALSEFIVADFMKNLQNSNYFKNVELKVIEKRKQIRNIQLRSFEINSSLDFLGKQQAKKSEEEEK